MIKVKVIGGLGNQLFQYATGRAVAEKLGTTLIIDISAFQSYNIHPLRLNKFKCRGVFSPKTKFFDKLLKVNIIRRVSLLLGLLNNYYYEKGLAYNENVFSINTESTLVGHFQSEKYFLSIRNELLSELLLIKDLSGPEKRVECSIKNTNSIAIHIRRGDYISNQSANIIHGTCDNTYFNKAISFLENNAVLNDSSCLYVFSDDISWCRDNLKFNYKCVFVEGRADKPEVDMYLMSLCQHQIISNSTFSWWGAWLNKNENKTVIAPANWFKSDKHDSRDIIPETWIKL